MDGIWEGQTLSPLILDASVALKLVIDEPGSEAAIDLIARADERIAPDWMLTEVASALSNKVRYEGIAIEEAATALQALPRFVERFVDSRPLLERTMRLSIKLGHALYDCLYLAVALEERGRVVTADEKFHKAAAYAGYGDQLELLLA